MPDSIQSLLIFILFAPGFLGYLVFSKLYCREIQDNIEKLSYVFVFNLLSLVSINAISSGVSKLTKYNLSSSDLKVAEQFIQTLLLPLSASSIVFAVTFAITLNKGVFQRFLVEIGATKKSHYSSVLTDVICTYPDSYFKIRFKDGAYVIGHPRRYSINGDEQILFLGNAARRPPRGTKGPQPPEKPIKGEGVMLLNFDEVQCVEILEGI
jgi:Family of unknown function (DUF6338)